MLNTTNWARIAALTASLAIATATVPVIAVQAQDSSLEAYKRARAGEDGSTGVGAAGGNTTTGDEAKRDKNGNGGNASAGSGGEATDSAGGGGGSGEATTEPLPENAETLAALGVLDDVTAYDLDILDGLNIPVELLPPAAEAPASAPADVNTGGEGATGETASGGGTTSETAPESGTTTEAAPAGGSTTTAAADGEGSSSNGEKKRDRAERREGGTEAPAG
jgi:hypothetical protein